MILLRVSLCGLCVSAFRLISQFFTWTSFGQLLSLDYLAAPALQNFAGGQIYAASRVQTDFSFDAGGNRARQLKQRLNSDTSSLVEETTYLGSYEREVHSSKSAPAAPMVLTRTVHRHSIGGFAVYTRTDKPGLPSETKLTTILKDHLGSTDLLYTGTWTGSNFSTPTPASIERQSFDPWGERRAPDTLVAYRTSDTDTFRSSAQDYDRGYTGHEQLDDSGLIHMNGRIYDPELGRMLSPDPFVQVPEYSQNFNRYSYVMNNPLNLTDPSGFNWLSNIFKKVGNWIKENWRTLVVIVVMALVTYLTFGTLSGAAAAWGTTILGATTASAVGATATAAVGGAFLGGIAGGLSAALAGGDLGDVLRGALIGGISGALAAGLSASTGVVGSPIKVAGQGVIGGARNVAMGGKFQDGFLSAAASSAAQFGKYADDGVFGLIKSSVVGGTASALGGGKFSNGASTAAFQYLVTSGARSLEKNNIDQDNKIKLKYENNNELYKSKITIYSSSGFGSRLIHHLYAENGGNGEVRGRAGLSGIQIDRSGNNPRSVGDLQVGVIELPKGVSEVDFMNHLDQNAENSLYWPWVNDCHDSIDRSARALGGQFARNENYQGRMGNS